MKRLLRFCESDAKATTRFTFLHRAVVLSQPQRPRSVDELRRVVGLLDKLDAISRPSDPPKGRDWEPGEFVPRTLADLPAGRTECVLELEQPEHDLLMASLNGTPWVSSVAREVVDTADFLAAAEKL